jgi:hypothetical protein
MIAALLLAASAAEPPVPATIAQVLASPRTFEGKWIEIDGYLNACAPLDCRLTEKLASRPINRGRGLSFEGQPDFDRWAAPVVPAKVRVRAWLDVACLTDQVCTDRAPMLRGMIVEPLQTNLTPPDKDQ